MPLRTIFYLALLLALLYGLFTIGFPFLLAFVLAFILEPLVLLLGKGLKIKRSYASVIICSLFTLLVVFLSYLGFVFVLKETMEMTRSLSHLARNIALGIDRLTLHYLNLLSTYSPEAQQNIEQIIQGMALSAQNILIQSTNIFIDLAKSIPNFFVEVLLTFIALFLFSYKLPRLKEIFLALFVPQSRDNVNSLMETMSRAVFGFIRAQLIISIMVFIFVFMGFLILGVSYPSATALLVTLVDILPVLGTGSVLVPMAAYQYLNGNHFMAFGLIIHYTLIIAFRRIVEPKILSDNVGIGPLSALISIYLAFKLTGFIGLFLGPFTVLLFQNLMKLGMIKINIEC